MSLMIVSLRNGRLSGGKRRGGLLGGPSPNRLNAMVVPSFEGIFSTNSPLQPFDIPGNFRQIVVELMSAAIKLINSCPREFFFVQREVCERHPFVIAAVVKEHRQLFGELRRKVSFQFVPTNLPILSTPVGRRDKEYPGNGLFHLLFGEIFQQDRTAQRMPNKKHLAIHRSEFFCDLIFPRLVLGAIFIWHL